jgi:hypothetical protein
MIAFDAIAFPGPRELARSSKDTFMAYLRPICLALGIISLTACSKPAVEAPPETPVDVRTALQGTWRSVDDVRSMMTIRDTTVIESYDGEALDTATLKIVADCDSVAPDPAGQYFTFEEPSAGVLCFALLDATGDHIAYSYAGRGNTLAFNRVPD